MTDERLRKVYEDFAAKMYPEVRAADVLPVERHEMSDKCYRSEPTFMRANDCYLITDF